MYRYSSKKVIIWSFRVNEFNTICITVVSENWGTLMKMMSKYIFLVHSKYEAFLDKRVVFRQHWSERICGKTHRWALNWLTNTAEEHSLTFTGIRICARTVKNTHQYWSERSGDNKWGVLGLKGSDVTRFGGLTGSRVSGVRGRIMCVSAYLQAREARDGFALERQSDWGCQMKY